MTGRVVAALGALAAITAFALLSSRGAPHSEGTMQDQSRTDPLRSTLPPGAEDADEGLEARLEEALASKGPAYRPRTRHLLPDGTPRFSNRLLLETSPYLLQHAHNPVNWFPWGEEAFAAARRLNRPVFLSIGYSTCHWCHVMEEESFEDEELARFLNEHYVPVKVDREERPDVDAIYMTAVQAMTGHGGWPMSVWLTPERKPYFAGTYFPARDGDRGASVGFLTILRRLYEAWEQEHERVVLSSEQVAEAIRQELSSSKQGAVDKAAVMRRAFAFYQSRFDAVEGGLNVHTKFPSQLPIRFLLRYARRTGDEQARHMATLTLEKMAAGGMYDHVGGGFHRYSTDPRWLVPHFEKMLYDNAQLCTAYLEGYQAIGDDDLARVAREILEYVRRDMTSPEGGFYSATDADSLAPNGHREEGWFFTWTPQELVAELGEGRADVVMRYYAVTAAGNFEGRSILHAPERLGEVARALGVAPEALRQNVDEARAVLYEARKERPAPLRDEKILTAWNGLMISAFAQGALVLDEPRYAEAGRRAAAFLLEHMREGGRLYRSYKDGAPRHAAYLDDYAFLIAGLLDLFEATSELRWLDAALELDEQVREHYEDKEGGGFFLTSDDHEELLVREKPAYDGAEPSGTSVHALNLLRLAELTSEDAYRARAERAFDSVGAVLSRSPASLSEMLLALDFATDKAREIVIATPRSREEAAPFLAELRRRFFPNRVLAVVPEPDLEAFAERLPPVAGKRPLEGQATAYVCERGVCDRPCSEPQAFAATLERKQPLP